MRKIQRLRRPLSNLQGVKAPCKNIDVISVGMFMIRKWASPPQALRQGHLLKIFPIAMSVRSAGRQRMILPQFNGVPLRACPKGKPLFWNNYYDSLLLTVPCMIYG